MLDIEAVGQRDYALIERFLDLIDSVWKPYHRFELRGVERIPEGAALYVGNHNGGLLSIDSFLFANEVFRNRGLADVPYGLAHDMVMNFLPAQRNFSSELAAFGRTINPRRPSFPAEKRHSSILAAMSTRCAPGKSVIRLSSRVGLAISSWQ